MSNAEITEGVTRNSQCTGSVHLKQKTVTFRVKADPLKRTNFDKYKSVEVNVMGSCCYKVFHRPKFRGEHRRLESAGTFNFPGKHVQSVKRVECRGVARAGGGPGGVAMAGVLLLIVLAGIIFRWRRGGSKKEYQEVEMEALDKHQKDIWTL